MGNGRKYGVGSILASIVFLIWFFASIGAMIYFSRHDMGALVVTLFGQFFLVMGTAAIISGIANKDFQPITLIFLLIGIACMVGGCIFQFGSETVIKHLENALPYLLLSVFLIVGVSLVLTTYVGSKRRHERCNYCISAICVDLKSQYHDGSRIYCPVYEVYFRDETIQISSNVFSNINRISVGETREIYLNPEKPTDFYEPKEEKAINIFKYVMGGLFTAAAVFALIMIIYVVK